MSLWPCLVVFLAGHLRHVLPLHLQIMWLSIESLNFVLRIWEKLRFSLTSFKCQRNCLLEVQARVSFQNWVLGLAKRNIWRLARGNLLDDVGNKLIDSSLHLLIEHLDVLKIIDLRKPRIMMLQQAEKVWKHNRRHTQRFLRLEPDRFFPSHSESSRKIWGLFYTNAVLQTSTDWYLELQTTSFKWMFASSTISHLKMSVHHPIDSQPFINGWPSGSRYGLYLSEAPLCRSCLLRNSNKNPADHRHRQLIFSSLL